MPYFPPEDAGKKALSSGVDAGAPVPLQSGLRGVREDSVPRPNLEEAPHRRAMSSGRGGVRGADGQHPGWRAADVPGDRPARRRAREPEEVRLPVHERHPPAGKAGPVHAIEVPEL